VAPNLKIIKSIRELTIIKSTENFANCVSENLLETTAIDKNDKINSEIWDHQYSLTPPLYIEVPVPIKGSERSYICVLGYRFCHFLQFFC